MPVSRRKFLHHGAFAAAAIAAAPLPAWSSGHQPPPESESQHATNALSHVSRTVPFLDRNAFEQAVGSAFEVSSGANSQPVWLTLLAVKELPALAPVDAGSMAVPPPPSSTLVATTGYMLSFQSSAQPLAQGTYAFQHPTLGKFQLFIVPGSQGSQSYTAVFNQLTGVTTPTPPHFRPRLGSRPQGTIGAGGSGISSGGAGGSSSGGAANSGGSTGGRPAQETLEPVLGRQLETKLPE
jgi:uncharacterized membrane protein YgcG